MSWETVLGYATGLYLINPHLDSETLVRTVCAVHVFDAIMCRLLAHNNMRPKGRWTLFGFVFGIWALIVLLLLPSRRRPPQ